MMVWRDANWARHALALGNDVVMATTSHTYFDYYQTAPAAELAKGLCYEAIGGYLPLETVYAYDPVFVAETPGQEQRILGTQGQLWGEYIKDGWKLEYMAFPRIAALAEVAWSPRAGREFDDFRGRLNPFYERLDVLGLSYRRADAMKIGEWESGVDTALEWDVTDLFVGPGQYDLCFNCTEGTGSLRLDSVALLADGREISRDSHEAIVRARKPRDPFYLLAVPAREAGVRYTVVAHRADDQEVQSSGAVTWERRAAQ